MALDLTTTTAGRAEILAALQEQRTIRIADVQVSSFVQSFTEATTQLQQPTATLPAQGAVRNTGAGFVLHLVMIDTSDALYNLRALAVRLANGTVLMGCAPAETIVRKTPESVLSLAIDLTIDAATAAAVSFGNADFALPAATTLQPGLVRLAATADVQALANDTVVTCSALGTALGKAASHRIFVPPHGVSPTQYALLRQDSFGVTVHKGSLPATGDVLRWTMPPVPRGSKFTRGYVWISRIWSAADAVLRFQVQATHRIRRALPGTGQEFSVARSSIVQCGGAFAQTEGQIEITFPQGGVTLGEGSLPGSALGHEVLLEFSSMTFNNANTAETPLLAIHGFGLEYTAPSAAPFLF